MAQKLILITGGAGFIGSNLIHYLIKNTGYDILNVDKLTYSGNLESLDNVSASNRYIFERADIADKEEMTRIFDLYKPDLVMNLAAESHVDRSIDGPEVFIQSNIIGTYTLLSSSLHYWKNLPPLKKSEFRFLHVSTDEVYGSLGATGFFTEGTAYDPRSPYSASKASSDHLVSAWHHTYGLPTLITNCSNNYGPFQYPEKLIPVIILNALENNPIPVYGKGDNVRDWLFVEDHARALITVAEKGLPGETYNVGGNNERTNLEIVHSICKLLDQIKPLKNGSYSDLISFVKDRPGHDKRYAIDATKIRTQLGFSPSYSFEEGIKETVLWYLSNSDWCSRVLSSKYNLERLGLINN